jgi:hypothetical protein
VPRVALTGLCLVLLAFANGCASGTPSQKRDAWEAERLPPGELTERTKIERLISTLRRSGVTFIRDDAEHTSAEAADAFQEALDGAESTMTARDFIEQIGTRSALTRKPYVVRPESGDSMTSRDWLLERLTEIEERHTAGR